MDAKTWVNQHLSENGQHFSTVVLYAFEIIPTSSGEDFLHQLQSFMGITHWILGNDKQKWRRLIVSSNYASYIGRSIANVEIFLALQKSNAIDFFARYV